jgi:hypothetical protein
LQNQAITFDATQKHAVINYGVDTVGIAGEVWKECDTHKLLRELTELSKMENTYSMKRESID